MAQIEAGMSCLLALSPTQSLGWAFGGRFSVLRWLLLNWSCWSWFELVVQHKIWTRCVCVLKVIEAEGLLECGGRVGGGGGILTWTISIKHISRWLIFITIWTIWTCPSVTRSSPFPSLPPPFSAAQSSLSFALPRTHSFVCPALLLHTQSLLLSDWMR